MFLAIAKSLVQLDRTRNNLSDGDMCMLERAESYLLVAELLHSIGHPALYMIDERERPSPHNDSKLGGALTASMAYRNLLRLFIRIQKLSHTEFITMNPPPWRPDSLYHTLQDDLEAVFIRRPVGHQFTNVPFTPTSDSAEPNSQALEEITFALLWHSCVVVLNRNFLPIPQRQPGPGPGNPTRVKPIYFPSAPALFLEEKTRACEASAAASCRLSRIIVSNSDFFQVRPSLPFDYVASGSCFRD